MGEQTHTPGPLVVRKAPGNIVPPFFDVERADHPGCVARVFASDTAEADANLFAAASEMREALRWYADQFCEFGTDNTGCGKFDDETCAGCKARAAIAKATAGQ